MRFRATLPPPSKVSHLCHLVRVLDGTSDYLALVALLLQVCVCACVCVRVCVGTCECACMLLRMTCA
jgi:hypothetical protein